MCIHHYNIVQNSFTDLKILCAPPIHSCFSLPEPWSFYCLHSFAFSRMSCSCNHIGCRLSNWFCSLSCMHWGPYMSFHGLIDYLFLLMNSMPFYVCTTVCLSIYLLKGILGAPSTFFLKTALWRCNWHIITCTYFKSKIWWVFTHLYTSETTAKIKIMNVSITPKGFLMPPL